MSRPKTSNPRGLTPKQQRFVLEYLIDLNATQAAVRAGYSARTADRIGPELLGKTWIAEAVQKAQEERAKAAGITAERILLELSRIAFGTQKDLAKWDSDGVSLLSSESLGDDQAAIVAEVSQRSTESGTSLKIKTHDKTKALELLGRHLGMFEDRVNVTGLGDLAARLAQARARAGNGQA